MPLSIQKHPESEISIIGYYSHPFEQKSMVWNSLTDKCRGVIVDSNGNIIEQPYAKFWTFRQYLSKDTILLSDGQTAKIESKITRIYEKMDGSMCTLYWVGDEPFLATQRSFTSKKAIKATDILHAKYINEAKALDRNYTYVFESIYPENEILIDYGGKQDLVLIGVIDKKTGKPVLRNFANLGFPLPTDYTQQFSKMNLNELTNLNIKNKEGFVIHYEDGSLLKLKFPWYSEMHRSLDLLINNQLISNSAQIEIASILSKKPKVLSTRTVWESMMKDDFSLIESRLTNIHFLLGVNDWIKSEKQILTESFNSIRKEIEEDLDSEIWMRCEPHKVRTFEVYKRLDEFVAEDKLMWNWKERFLDIFI